MPPRKSVERFPTHISEFGSKNARYVAHDSPLENVVRIINEGVLSYELAKKTKRPIRRDGAFGFYYQDPDKVTVWDSKKTVGKIKFGDKLTLADFFTSKIYERYIQVFAKIQARQLLEPSNSLSRQAYSSESEINDEITPRQIVAIKLPTEVYEKLMDEIKEAASRQGIPIYGPQGNRIWPPLRK